MHVHTFIPTATFHKKHKISLPFDSVLITMYSPFDSYENREKIIKIQNHPQFQKCVHNSILFVYT